MNEADAATVAAVTQRLAVLLQAGLAPARAWEHLATTGEPVAVAVVEGAADGCSTDAVLRAHGEAWAQIAVAWQVAATVGAPLAQSLRGLADALRDAHQARDEIRVALAEPQTTARLIAWLPLVALGMGAALGFDPLRVFTRPVGLALLTGGVTLMVVTRRWTRALVTRAQPEPGIPGLDAEVLAIGLSGGVSIPRALAVYESSAGRPPDSETIAVLDLSQAAGAPAVELLRAEAAARRQRARTDGRLRAARLGARLLLPMGVCTLPAFLLLGVGPMLLSVVTTTPLTL